MGEKELVTYFDFAENDYEFFKGAYENGFVANSMAAIAQGICEKYLKYLIELDSDHRKQQYESVMKTHNIRKLLKYIKQEVPEFHCDEGSIKKVDGYYFNTRYTACTIPTPLRGAKNLKYKSQAPLFPPPISPGNKNPSLPSP